MKNRISKRCIKDPVGAIKEFGDMIGQNQVHFIFLNGPWTIDNGAFKWSMYDDIDKIINAMTATLFDISMGCYLQRISYDPQIEDLVFDFREPKSNRMGYIDIGQTNIDADVIDSIVELVLSHAPKLV